MENRPFSLRKWPILAMRMTYSLIEKQAILVARFARHSKIFHSTLYYNLLRIKKNDNTHIPLYLNYFT